MWKFLDAIADLKSVKVQEDDGFVFGTPTMAAPQVADLLRDTFVQSQVRTDGGGVDAVGVQYKNVIIDLEGRGGYVIDTDGRVAPK